MDVKAKILHPFQHDRFYRMGETVDMPQELFDDLEPRGLVSEATEDGAQAERKTKPKAK